MRSAATRAPAAIIGRATGIDEQRSRLHACQVVRRDDATGLAVARQVQAEHIGVLEKRFAAGGDLEALGLRTGRRALATPAHDVHAKRLPYARHGCTDMAEGVHAERTPKQACADCRVPMAVFEAFHFIGKMAQRREYQTPRELGGGGIGAAAPAPPAGGDHDTLRGAGGDIEVVGVAPCLTDKPEPGEALDDLTSQRHTLLREH